MAVTNAVTHLECHGNRHDWDEVSVKKVQGFRIKIVSVCVQCGGSRQVMVDWPTGAVISRNYWLPKDYKNFGWTKADYRKALIASKLKKKNVVS
jgi:hypothetical protein